MITLNCTATNPYLYCFCFYIPQMLVTKGQTFFKQHFIVLVAEDAGAR